jgi:flagellar motility protein MotE (MotC chaperone)
MIRAIVTGLLVLFGLHCFAVFGLIGYAALTGKLNKDRRELYKKVWSGQDLVQAEESVDAEQQDDQGATAQVAQQLDQAQSGKELLTLDVQRHLENLENMKRSVQAGQAKLLKDRKEYLTAMDVFEQERDRKNRAARSEGFLRELDYFSRLKPKLAKEDFMAMVDAEAARFLSAMKPDVATKILNYFRTDDEQKKRQRVMALIETLGVDDFEAVWFTA